MPIVPDFARLDAMLHDTMISFLLASYQHTLREYWLHYRVYGFGRKRLSRRSQEDDKVDIAIAFLAPARQSLRTRIPHQHYQAAAGLIPAHDAQRRQTFRYACRLPFWR